MRKLILIGITFFVSTAAFACEVCKRNQPKALQEFTHGAGPGGATDYIIMGTAVVVVIITLYLSIKFLISPNEDNADHVKNIVTNEDF